MSKSSSIIVIATFVQLLFCIDISFAQFVYKCGEDNYCTSIICCDDDCCSESDRTTNPEENNPENYDLTNFHWYYQWYYWVAIAIGHFVVIGCIIFNYRRLSSSRSSTQFRRLNEETSVNITSRPIMMPANRSMPGATANHGAFASIPINANRQKQAEETVEAIILSN